MNEVPGVIIMVGAAYITLCALDIFLHGETYPIKNLVVLPMTGGIVLVLEYVFKFTWW